MPIPDRGCLGEGLCVIPAALSVGELTWFCSISIATFINIQFSESKMFQTVTEIVPVTHNFYSISLRYLLWQNLFSTLASQ